MREIILLGVIVLLILIFNKIKSVFNILNENNKYLKTLNNKINTLKALEDKAQPILSSPLDTVKETLVKPNENELEKPVVPERVVTKPVLKTEEKESKEVPKISEDAVKIITPEKPKRTSIPRKSLWEKFKEKNPDLEKFIGENLANKLGILILVLGISFFVKYAIDKNWINEPARVGIGILAGSLVMLIANRLRKKYAAFSSVLVAGAIAVFYFTIAIAFHEYQLFSQSVAFGIMVVITIFSSLISLSYNRKELAILSLIGGFAVPFMVSTGSGNYIVLFTYIIVLNLGILALAYYKKWKIVNILAFIFTVLLFGSWFVKDCISEKPHYLDALLFAFAFYFIFIVTNIINNVRTKTLFSKAQLAILAVSTFLFFIAGMVVLKDYHPELRGLFTAGLALLNLIYAWFLYKKFNLDKTAVFLLIGLTLTFITLAIPIQFKGNYITLFWAAEAVLLLWLAQKSNIKSYRFASVIVHILAIISLLIDWGQKYDGEVALKIIFNPIFGTGLFVVASLFATYFLLKKETGRSTLWGFTLDSTKYRKYIFITGVVVAYFVGFHETFNQADAHLKTYTAFSIPALYHMVFTLVVVFVLYKRNTVFNTKLVNIIASINVALFAFVFLNLSYIEHRNYEATVSNTQLAFYLHYVLLALTCYFGYIIYVTNKDKLVFGFLNKKLFFTIAAFFVIFIASSEVMLIGLKTLSDPVTLQEVQANEYFKDYPEDLKFIKEDISANKIHIAKQKIIKTAFPVVWGILAFFFLIFGIRKQIKTVRIIALALLGITIAKLFLYDINNISETGKIIAFILLGVLILIISFVYQKIKVLVIDDKPKPNDSNETN